jgi:NAD-dependent dihydropyrimidine dehydrogenase PreA subunit
MLHPGAAARQPPPRAGRFLPAGAAGPRFEGEFKEDAVSLSIDESTCEKTGVCASVCPEDVFKFEEGDLEIVNAQACTYCWLCVDNCVSGAIDLD